MPPDEKSSKASPDEDSYFPFPLFLFGSSLSLSSLHPFLLSVLNTPETLAFAYSINSLWGTSLLSSLPMLTVSYCYPQPRHFPEPWYVSTRHPFWIIHKVSGQHLGSHRGEWNLLVGNLKFMLYVPSPLTPQYIHIITKESQFSLSLISTVPPPPSPFPTAWLEWVLFLKQLEQMLSHSI